MSKTTISIFELMEKFPDDSTARKHLELIRWKNGKYCPDCGSDNIYVRTGKREGQNDCRDCRRVFNVKTGTVFEGSHIKLHKWIYGIYILMTGRNGISSLQLTKQIGITQKSAWFILHRLRQACGSNMEMLTGIVEADETYIGGKEKNKHSNKKLRAGRGATGKKTVLGMRERGGRVKAMPVDGTDRTTLQSALHDHVEQGSIVYTDEHRSYQGLIAGMAALDQGLDFIMAAETNPIQQDINMPQIFQADSTVRGVLPKESVDLIITSPPYNVGKEYSGDADDDSMSYAQYAKFSKKWLAACHHWSRPTGRLAVNVSIDKNKNGKQPLSADLTRWAMEAGWKYHATILWNEGNISRRTAWGSWKSASAPHIIAPVETIIVLYKDTWKRERPGENDITADEFKDWVFGIWSFNGANGKHIGHDAPFPLELPHRLIKLLSFKNDIILDPFLGSGTTMIGAINNGRTGIGIELESRYCELALKRIESQCDLKLDESPVESRKQSIKKFWTV